MTTIFSIKTTLFKKRHSVSDVYRSLTPRGGRCFWILLYLMTNDCGWRGIAMSKKKSFCLSQKDIFFGVEVGFCFTTKSLVSHEKFIFKHWSKSLGTRQIPCVIPYRYNSGFCFGVDKYGVRCREISFVVRWRVSLY